MSTKLIKIYKHKSRLKTQQDLLIQVKIYKYTSRSTHTWVSGKAGIGNRISG